MSKIEMQCIIDTLSIKIEFSNMSNIVIPESVKEFVTRDSDKVEKGSKTVTLNLHRITGEYRAIKSLKEFKSILNEVLEEMNVVNNNEVELNRLDIAIDNDLNFNENFKFFLMLFDLYTFKHSKKDRWYTTNIDTLKQNTIIWNNSHYEVVFYDKNEQSNGAHEFNTRMEFRFKRLSKMDFEKHIDKLIENISILEENIQDLESSMSSRLIELWKEEKGSNVVSNFTEFVKKYNNYFYTTNIIKIVYKETGLKGSYSKWVERFRERYNLEFYSKSNITKVKRQMIKSIKAYKKS